jgi:hypothetical protein
MTAQEVLEAIHKEADTTLDLVEQETDDGADYVEDLEEANMAMSLSLHRIIELCAKAGVPCNR